MYWFTTANAKRSFFPLSFLFLLSWITQNIFKKEEKPVRWLVMCKRLLIDYLHWLVLLFLAWKIPWMEDPGRLQSMGSLRLDMTERLHFHFSLSCMGEGNSNPLQCSCLENPRDRGAWWAGVYGVAQSRTRLKWLSLGRIFHFCYSA